jgi:hypothetical protein
MSTLQTHFDNHNNIYGMNLSRFTALLIILKHQPLLCHRAGHPVGLLIHLFFAAGIVCR